jgi:hypothetical protein
MKAKSCELFDAWLRKHHGSWFAHAVWDNNVSTVLQRGQLSPGEYLLREYGEVDYEFGVYGDRGKITLEQCSDRKSIKADMAKSKEERIDRQLAMAYEQQIKETPIYRHIDKAYVELHQVHKPRSFIIEDSKLNIDIRGGYRSVFWSYGSFVVLKGNANTIVGFQGIADRFGPRDLRTGVETNTLLPATNRGEFLHLKLQEDDVLLLCSRKIYEANRTDFDAYSAKIVITEELTGAQLHYLHKAELAKQSKVFLENDVCVLLKDLEEGPVSDTLVKDNLRKLSLADRKSFIHLIESIPNDLELIFNTPSLFDFCKHHLTEAGITVVLKDTLRMKVAIKVLQEYIIKGRKITESLIALLFDINDPVITVCDQEKIDYELLDLLLLSGYDINARSHVDNSIRYVSRVKPIGVVRIGDSALVAAVERGDDKCISYLLKHNANPNSKNKYGRTSLFYAPNKSLAQRLLESNADHKVSDNEGRSIFHLGLNLEVKQFLAEHDPTYFRACLQTSDNHGMTPLHGFHPKYPNIPKEEEDTNWHLNPEWIRFYLGSGANISALNAKKQTPLNIYLRYYLIHLLPVFFEIAH